MGCGQDLITYKVLATYALKGSWKGNFFALRTLVKLKSRRSQADFSPAPKITVYIYSVKKSV